MGERNALLELPADLREEAVAVVGRLAQIMSPAQLEARIATQQSFDYGNLLFCSAVGAWSGRANEAALALEPMFERLVPIFSHDPSFSSGTLCLAWLTAQLFEAPEIVQEFEDRALAWFGPESTYPITTDWQYGLAGAAAYAAFSGSEPLATLALAGLAQRAERGPAGIYWKFGGSAELTLKSILADPTVIDLGLAHGQPGIWLALTMIAEKFPKLAARATALLKEGLAFGAALGLFDVAQTYPREISLEHGAPRSHYRAAWCYGALGASIAMARAGKLLQDEGLFGAAMRRAHAEALRTPEESGIVDHGLCHGSFGIAHVCRRLAEAYDDELLARQAVSWLRYGLAQADTSKELLYEENMNGNLSSNLSFLKGSSGIGLAILGFLDRRGTPWDVLLGLGSQEGYGLGK